MVRIRVESDESFRDGYFASWKTIQVSFFCDCHLVCHPPPLPFPHFFIHGQTSFFGAIQIASDNAYELSFFPAQHFALSVRAHDRSVTI